MKFKKILYWLAICLWALGAIGGIGYTAYCGAWVIMIGVAATALMAFPKVIEFFNILKS